LAEKVASILAEVGIDSSKFTAGANGITGGIGQILGGLSKMGIGVGIAMAAIGFLVDELKKMEAAAEESAIADAKLGAVLRSTGGAAGISKDALDGYAASLSKMSGIDDELIVSAEAVLLTFTKISGSVFPEVMQAAVDMSAVLGGDLQGAVVQVGKAFNDFNGYTALKRAGVSFTATQIDQIKKFKETNDVIGYQKMLLAELKTEFGGAAEAMEKASDGSENLKIAFGNLREAAGSEMVGVTRGWNEFWTEFIDFEARALRIKTYVKELMSADQGRTNSLFDYFTGQGQGFYEAQSNVENILKAQDAYRQSLIAQARAYYALHPELGKYVDEMGQLRDVTTGATEATEEDAAALKAKIETLAAMESAYADAKNSATDWKESWTAIAEGPEQIAERGEKSFDLLGDKLRELGADGADVWDGLLMATGRISPEAIMQLAAVEDAVRKAKEALEKGIDPSVVASWIKNYGPLQGVFGNAPTGTGTGDWTKKGTKGGPGTVAAWQDSFGNWYFGETPPGTGAPVSAGETFPETVVNTTQAESALATVQARLDGLVDKTVTVTVNSVYNGNQIGAAEIATNYDLNGNGIIGKAGGGPIWSNKPYLVGERGPEIIVPTQPGNVVPNNQLGGNVVNFFGDAYFEVEGEVAAQDILKQARVEV
jgi:hypothetical protein